MFSELGGGDESLFTHPHMQYTLQGQLMLPTLDEKPELSQQVELNINFLSLQ